MDPADEARWEQAVDLARAAYDRDDPILDIVRYERTPYLVGLDYREGRVQVLVHDGAVVRERGLTALARYLRESGVLDRAALTAADAVGLVELFEALPPVAGYADPATYLVEVGPEALQPRVRWADGELAVTLYYWVRDERGGGEPLDPHLKEVAAWTLTVTAGGAAWNEHILTWDTDREKLVSR